MTYHENIIRRLGILTTNIYFLKLCNKNMIHVSELPFRVTNEVLLKLAIFGKKIEITFVKPIALIHRNQCDYYLNEKKQNINLPVNKPQFF